MPPQRREPATTSPLAFVVPLLPLILSADPTPLPRTLLAQSAQQAVHYLALTAEDDEYWTLGRKDEGVARLRRQLVEAGSIDDLALSPPAFSHDLEELRCRISLSLPDPSRSSSLGIVLVWEDAISPLSAAQGGAPDAAGSAKEDDEEDDIRPGWTFLELQALAEPTPSPAGESWYPTIEEAVAASTAGFVRALESGGRTGAGAEEAGVRQSARRDEREKLMQAMAGYESDEASLRDGAARQEGEKEGEASGGAIASAEDFWSGWDDHEDETEGAKTPNGRDEAGGAREEEEQGYWDSYSGVGSQVGEDDDLTQLGRISLELSPSDSALAPHNPQPAFHLALDSASSVSSYDSDPRPLYFSSTLPPLPESHFGISPTQPDPEISRFSTTDTADSVRSEASHYDFLAEPSEDDEDADELRLPKRMDVAPARSASLAQAVPALAAQPQPQVQAQQPRPAPARPKRHARTASDILKALPSVPAFPVVSRPRHASGAAANGANGATGSTTQVLEGSVYVNAPGGGGSGPGPSPTRSSTAQRGASTQRSPTSPARTPTAASFPFPSTPSSAPRSPTKALPPAPPTRAVSHSQSVSFASPSSTKRSKSSSGVPRTLPANPRVSNGVGGEAPRSPVRNGRFWAPPPPPPPAASISGSSSNSSARTINISAAPTRQGSQTTPLPSRAVFPDLAPPSTSTSPSSASDLPLPPPPGLFPVEETRGSVDSTATGLTGMLEELVRGTLAHTEGEPEEGTLFDAGLAKSVADGLKLDEVDAAWKELDEEDEALGLALSALWRLYARRPGAAGVEWRRRRFEAAVRRVVRE